MKLRLILLSLPLLMASTAIAAGESLHPDSLLAYLYRYMPAPDKAMYPASFWRQNVEASLRARHEMPWGVSVPLREWMHFVLPVRVNNEDLDMSRPLFYSELKERVKGLSMADAILEVNHWCHEKVSYRPSDARTSSPLSSVSQAIGRCGEESTFAVAALRSVGIPARQVYTPRWAHTDDNHAWVEAWADGSWHFIGACEPEPLLDLAWFNMPASRAMMMHTGVFGRYHGPEEVMDSNACYTTINVTPNYAPTAMTRVTVTDAQGKPVPGAKVRFALYNYAEYFPMATLRADGSGVASLRTGKGDLIVWCYHDGRFGIAKAGAGEAVTVPLRHDASSRLSLDFDLTPPPPSAAIPAPTPDQIRCNARRLTYEDSIRNAYIASFVTAGEAVSLASRLNLDPDSLSLILTQSRGNHEKLTSWLESLTPPLRAKAVRLLMAVSEKDRRDASLDVLADCLLFTPDATAANADMYDAYVLNPRIENEGLSAYRRFFHHEVSAADMERYRRDPQSWVDTVTSRVEADTATNPRRLRISPEAVWTSRKADPLGVSICIVAGLRSFGVPARIDPVTGKTQFADKDSRWHDALAESHATLTQGTLLRADTIMSPVMADPLYYSHFSLSKIDADGFPRQMEYAEGTTLSQWLASSPVLDAGQYLLTTGQRLADGSVLAHTEIFTVAENQHSIAVPFIFRSDESRLQVIGTLDAECRYLTLAGEEKSLLSTAGRGYYAVGLIAPGHEPSAHVLNEISAMSAAYGELAQQSILLFRNSDEASRFDASSLRLPANLHFGIDATGEVLRQLTSSLNLTTPLQLPVIVIADSFGRIVRVWEGYTIGIPETILRLMQSL